jgi:hypothetical protein
MVGHATWKSITNNVETVENNSIMVNQKQLILLALKRWISPLDALKQAGTMKLSTRVGELRLEGYNIDSKWSDDGRYKMYRLMPRKG